MTRKLTYREIVREFLLFLKTEHVYKRYITSVKHEAKNKIKNWENYINVLTIYPLTECFKDGRNIDSLIEYAFTWSYTKEGSYFWAEISQKWRDKIKDTEIVAEKLTNN